MSTRRRSSTALAAATVVAVVAGTLLASTALAQAATSYTWTGGYDVPGADHHSWSDPLNWYPQGVPGDGDTVVVPGVAGQGATYVRAVPAVTLAGLTVAGTTGNAVHLGEDGDALTVDGTFSWTGGEIVTDVTLGPDATGTISGSEPKSMSGDLTDAGTLTLDDMGVGGVTLRWSHALTVTPTGTLRSTGTSGLTHDRCCTDPDRLVNQGTVEVADGTFTVDGVEVDHTGTWRTAVGATAVVTASPVRLGPAATYSGGGTVAIDDAPDPSPDPEHPDLQQGGVLLSGTTTLEDGTRLVASSGTPLTGTGTVAGDGALDLDGAIVYADLTTDPGVAVGVLGGRTTRVSVWDRDLAGYHGQISVAGAAAVANGTDLELDQGTTTTLARGASLTLPGGAGIVSRTCCTDVPELVVGAGATMRLGGGELPTTLDDVTIESSGSVPVVRGSTVTLGSTTLVQRAGVTTVAPKALLDVSNGSFTLRGGTLRGSGRVAGATVNTGGVVAPGTSRTPAVLRLDSYQQSRRGTLALDVKGKRADRLVLSSSATLGGRLTVSGKPAAHARLTVVTAPACSGRFAKVKARGLAVDYARKRVSLVSR